MSQDTADIVGTTGARFTFTIDRGTIPKGGATLLVTGQADKDLEVKSSGREVVVPDPGLPGGDSTVSLALIWTPGDHEDAIVAVGTVSSGTVTAATPPPYIENGQVPGYVTLFGVKQ